MIKTMFTIISATNVVPLMSWFGLFPTLLVSAETVLKLRNDNIVTDIVRTSRVKPNARGPHSGVRASRLPLLLPRRVP